MVVEAGAGDDPYPDQAYATAGARIAEDEALVDADVVLKVQAPIEEEIDAFPEGCLARLLP